MLSNKIKPNEERMMDMEQTLELRESFWTPYEQMQEHIGKKFDVVRELTAEEIGDSKCEGELFKIRLEDGTEIDAWFEEIHMNSCRVNGVLI